ncbi:MAG: acyl carrier protein [Oscillospiraceae bacterium]|nr:acyl carrier protein [Oscillospiraceae bacterium]
MVFEKVRTIIVEQLGIEEDKVALSSNIQDDFGADSLDIVDLIGNFEEEFDLEIPDDQVEKIKTVEDVVEYIKLKVED